MNKISGIATYLPEKVVTNDDLSKTLDTSHEWIYTRTGIASRHIAAEDEFASDMALKAAQKLIEKTNLDPNTLDAVIVSTISADRRFPSIACKVQGVIGASKAFAFDLSAACAGFVYGLSISDAFMKTMKLKKIMLIGTECISKILDWTDRATCVLFGDGAAAVLLEADSSDKGIVATKIYSDGATEKYDMLLADGELQGKTGIQMSGRSVFKYAIECMGDSMTEILKENNMTLDDIDWIIPHQANKRIIESLCKLKEFPLEKVIVTTDTHANTSSASIPLALGEGIKDGRVKPGQTLLFTAFGAGLAWGSAIIKL